MFETNFSPELIERFLAYRPAVRVIYYDITPDRHLKTMLGLHQNGMHTLPGGRVNKDDLTYPRLGDCLWHNTMFRELREEINQDDMGIIAAMMAGDFRDVGTVLWKHPTREHP